MNQRETGDLGQGSVGKLLLRLALPTITAQLRDNDSGVDIATLALRVDGGAAVGVAHAKNGG